MLDQSPFQVAVQKMFVGEFCTLSKTLVFSGIDAISGLKWKAYGKIHTCFLAPTYGCAHCHNTLDLICAQRFWFEQPFSVGTSRARCFQIFIGGWGNTKTAIRRDRAKPDKAVVDTPDILSDAEYRGFWVRWEGGLLEVGKEGSATAFVSWHDPEPFGIGYYGICTGWGASGSWIIEGE